MNKGDGDWYLSHVFNDVDGGLTISARRKVSVEEYQRLEEARRAVNRFIGARHVVQAVYENKVDLIKAVVELAATLLEDEAPSELAMKVGSDDISRRLANMCSLFRSFIDHFEGFFKRKFGRRSPEFREWRNLVEIESCSLGYKIIFYMRNYIQHFDMPPLRMRVRNSVEEEGISLEIRIICEELKNDREFARRVELSTLDTRGLSLFKVLDEWNDCFQRIERQTLSMRAVDAVSAARIISDLRNNLDIDQSGRISMIWLERMLERPQNLSLEMAYYPEDEAKGILADHDVPSESASLI